jgi:broad specificity phosphatase PhoE
MKLWFETHATSVDNERGVASGHLDVGLSEAGRQQAAELGCRYADRQLTAVFTSDLARAIDTAAIAFGERGLSRLADPRLRECDYGSWSGCPVQQMNEARLEFVEQPFPGGESYRDVVRRTGNFLADLDQRSGPVLVIGHRATWYAFEHLLRERDLAMVIAAPWAWQPGWEYSLQAGHKSL